MVEGLPEKLDSGEKHVLLSKTIWINAIMALSIFIPKVHDYLAAHPDVLLYVMSGVNIVMRLLSKDALYLRD